MYALIVEAIHTSIKDIDTANNYISSLHLIQFFDPTILSSHHATSRSNSLVSAFVSSL